ncbi:xanthine dehydrogenase family protein subunit M [Sneathiella sp. P13V-1]|uniref:FAD binding domain-containing protein n=1 Tax=Sneathiella sp. P13V-1 TaxID=2697366 RepID=UPI00187B4FA9|nr:FAD binding domain-containing protein [Sneathiella sp. P13V-1]MBE7637255.1 xanthine dehydrogenase family protein subunit M [Sneathiella sp. P13V-1]
MNDENKGMRMGKYSKPESLEEALECLKDSAATILAGGTDLYANESFKADNLHLIDISEIQSLCEIESTSDGWWIGSAVSWSEVAKADLPPLFDGLREAARMIGGRQVQNAGTVGGNICNASPAADSVPPLMAMNTSVEIRNIHETRLVKLDQFIKGRRDVDLRPDEMVTRLFVPDNGKTSRSVFLKTGARAQLVISPVMATGILQIDHDDVIIDFRISIGACSPVAKTLDSIGDRVRGLHMSEDLSAYVREEDFDILDPISDMRGDAEYRLNTAKSMTRRLIRELQVAHV